MTTILLVLFLWKGALTVKAMPAPDMETCIAAMPEVAKRFPDTANISCITLKDEKDI
jgi:hypothetical protein